MFSKFFYCELYHLVFYYDTSIFLPRICYSSISFAVIPIINEQSVTFGGEEKLLSLFFFINWIVYVEGGNTKYGSMDVFFYGYVLLDLLHGNLFILDAFSQPSKLLSGSFLYVYFALYFANRNLFDKIVDALCSRYVLCVFKASCRLNNALMLNFIPGRRNDS